MITQFGGANSYRHGILKRRLDPIVIVTGGTTITSSPAVPIVTRTSLCLSGLSGSLNVIIGGGSVGSQTSLSDPAPVQNLPAGGVTMQLVPAMLLPSQPRLFGRSVFQDPAALQNQDHPLPQDLPFSWEFETESDEVWISCVINGPVLAATWGAGSGAGVGASVSSIIIGATVEYIGAQNLTERMDIEAVQRALAQVKLNGTQKPVYIQTGT